MNWEIGDLVIYENAPWHSGEWALVRVARIPKDLRRVLDPDKLWVEVVHGVGGWAAEGIADTRYLRPPTPAELEAALTFVLSK
jgi:hypothetical protein